jgi:hypothetical protein
MANFLNTRIRLKYDLFDNWSTKNPVLLEGEVAIAVPGTKVGSVDTNASCLMKVGNGTSHFNDLPWLNAVAADVHAWAKKSEADFKSWLTSADGPKLATQEDLTKLGTRVTNIENELNTEGTGLKARVTAVENELNTETTGLKARMTAAEGDIDSLEGKVEALEAITGTGNTGDGKTLISRIEALETDNGTNKTNIAENTTNIGKNTTAIGVLNGDVNTAGSVAKAVADAVAVEKGRAEEAEGNLQDAIDVINGTAETEGSIKHAVAAEATARGTAITEAKNELQGNIDAVSDVADAADALSKENQGKLNTLIGTDTGLSARAIAADEINTLIKGSDPEGGKTIEDIANLVKYVDENAGEIAELVSTVEGHTTSIGTLTESVNGLTAKDGELADDITEINTLIGALGEGEKLPYEKATLIESLKAVDTAAQTAASTAKTEAVAAAKEYTDKEIKTATAAHTELDNRVTKVEGKLAGVADGEKVTDLIATAKGEAISAASTDATNKANAAQAAAEATAAADATTKANNALASAKTYTNEEIGKVNTSLTEYKKTVVTGAKDANNNVTLSLGDTSLADLVIVCGNATV